jgi:hypothetical protein
LLFRSLSYIISRQPFHFALTYYNANVHSYYNNVLKAYLPSEKYFDNAPKFKSSPQNNGKSTGFLKQMLCGTRACCKYLSKYNLKIWIATRKSRGRNLNFGEILNFFHRVSYETRDNLNKSGMLSDGAWATDAVI